MAADYVERVLSALHVQGWTGTTGTARCPAHNDKTASVVVSLGEKNNLVLFCHAGCPPEAVCQAAGLQLKDLFDPQDKPAKKRREQPPSDGELKTYTIEQICQWKFVTDVYPYHDENGDPTMVVVRTIGQDGGKKGFSQFRHLGGGRFTKGLGEGEQRVQLVPYRLPRVLEAVRAGETVYLVEGEKDCATLEAWGLPASTNPGGAGKWPLAFSAFFQSAHVVVLPDADEPGRAHAEDVARSLLGKAASVKVLELPGLSLKGDVTDWKAAGGTLEQFLELVAQTPEWKSPVARPADGSAPEAPKTRKRGGGRFDTEDSREDSRSNVALELIEIGKRSGDLFLDERGEPQLAVEVDGIRRCYRLKTSSSGVRQYLAGTLYEETGKAASGEALGSAINVLAHTASSSKIVRPMYNRFAVVRSSTDGTLEEVWHDCGDGSAVCVTAAGWQSVFNPPVYFRRYPHQKTLPRAVPGGSLPRLIAQHLKLSDEKKQIPLVTAWMVAAMVSDVPRPGLALYGPQGAAKTSAAKCLRGVLDPSATPTTSIGKCEADLALSLDQNAVPLFDNLRSLEAWTEDMLCQAVTGGSFAKKQLYTDDDVVLMAFMRPLLMTGINVAARAPDLLDRLILVGLQRIEETDRREEAELAREVEEAVPHLLGAVYDALSVAMRIYPTVRLSRLPRLADFGRWGAAVAEATGLGQKAFIEAYLSNVEEQTAEVLSADVVSKSLLAFIDKKGGTWSGTASDLFYLLRPEHNNHGWPKSAAAFTRRLNTLSSTLAHVGVKLETDRSSAQRTITLSMVANDDIRDDNDAIKKMPSPNKDSRGSGYDDNDANDDISLTLACQENVGAVHGATGHVIEGGVRIMVASLASQSSQPSSRAASSGDDIKTNRVTPSSIASPGDEDWGSASRKPDAA